MKPKKRLTQLSMSLSSAIFILTLLLLSLVSPVYGDDPPEQKKADYTIFLPLVLKGETPIPPSGNPAVGYATAGDRTLIRWLWNEDDLGPATFYVYRQPDGEGESLLAQVDPVTDPTEATNLLNTTDARWPTLAADLIARYSNEGITTITELQTFISESGLIDLKLAAEFYPVALMQGWGYLDMNFEDGKEYTYRVEADTGNEVRDLGSVTLMAGQLTPLDAPTGLVATDMSDSGDFVKPRGEDWSLAQRNLRFEKQVYLGWDVVFEDENTTDFPQVWITGWDVYRAPITDVNQMEQVNGDDSVQPMPAVIPMDDTAPLTGELAYEQVPYFYLDEAPGYGDFYYRIAPRDLLGQVRQWPAHTPQFSEAVIATAHDFTPPPPPTNIQATSFPTFTDKVVVTWEMTPTNDFDHFQIERTLSLSNTTPVHKCLDDNLCWKVATTTTTTVWTDTDSSLETVRWYRVRAVDEWGNRSAPIGPVQGVLHDVTPPPRPDLRGTECQRDPGQFCLTGANISTDTTRMRLSCKFSQDGEELFIKEIEGNVLDEFNIVQDIFAPPVSLEDVMCTLIAVDAHGNLSEPSPPATLDLKSPEVKQISAPIITGSTTLPGGVYSWTAQLHWDVAESAGLGGFDVIRQEVDTANIEIFSINNGGVRTYNDDTVKPSTNYSYTVVAKAKSALYGEDQKSQPHHYLVLNNGVRPLQKMDWIGLNWLPGNKSVSLQWDAPPGHDPNQGIAVAVYRSMHQNSDYVQISPISLQSTRFYNDGQATHQYHWYVIVEFDTRTGEPIAYTEPGQPFNVNFNNFDVEPAVITPTSSISNCTPYTFTASITQPLHFGGGFDLMPTAYNLSPDMKTLTSGIGDLILQPQSGPITLTNVIFTDLTIGDAEQHICGGTLDVPVSAHYEPGTAIMSQAPGGLKYSVRQIIAKPWYGTDTAGSGEIWLSVPTHTTVITGLGSAELSYVELSSPTLKLDAGLIFSADIDLNTTLPTHTCQLPEIGFNLETLPVTVVPLNDIHFDPFGITMSDSCMNYLDRFTPGVGTPRPTYPNVNAADANDGYLRTQYDATTTTLTIDGVSADYTTLINASLAWITSYPYGLNVSVAGAQIDLAISGNEIISGSIINAGGNVSLAYQQTVTDDLTAQVTGTFTTATIDPGGAIFAQVEGIEKVGWMKDSVSLINGFELEAGDWEMYLGPVTTPGLPAQIQGNTPQTVMWETRPNDATDVGASLPPAELEMGLNRRLSVANLQWANCSGPAVDFDAAIDTYLRHGGISQQHKAKLNGVLTDIDIHGYDSALDNFHLSFLDNYIWDSNITGELYLPFPAGIDLRLVNIWLKTNACVGGGEVPANAGIKTLEYWDIESELRAVEFREDPAPDLPLPNWDAVLWTLGEFEVPNLKLPNQANVIPLEGEAAFRPNGTFFDFQFFYDQADFEVQGFPILVEKLRLSDVGEDPNWDPNANASAPPANKSWDTTGFVGLDAVWVAPYFTALNGQDDNPGMETYLLGWDDYVGFDGQPSIAKTWTDLDSVKLLLEFLNIVYVYNEDTEEGAFVAFRNIGFVPDAVMPPFEPKHKVVNLDMSAVIKGDTLGSFIGLSAGTAAFRALAEVTQPSLVNPPDDAILDDWGNKLAMNNANDYKALLNDVWAGYGGQSYLDTTNVLDDYDDAANTDLPDTFGGGTGGLLDDKGVSIKRMRGDIIMTGLGSGIQFERFQVSTELTVKGANKDAGDGDPMLYVEKLHLEINRHADFIMEAKNIQSDIFGSTLESIDATLRINPVLPQFEGGITLHHLDLQLVHFNYASAVLGVGAELNYLGLDAAGYPKSKPDLFLGGSILFGTIDPNSPVLSNHFEDLMTKLQEEVPGEPPLAGFYLRVYVGGIPIYDVGCMVNVKAGVGFALWYFAFGEGDTFGGQIRGSVYGTGLCIVSVRGDVTLTYSNTNGNQVFNGQAYVAGGIGFCEPGTWDGWNARWWNDKWCAQGGAYVEVEYKTIDDSWDIDYELDREKLL